MKANDDEVGVDVDEADCDEPGVPHDVATAAGSTEDESANKFDV